MNMRRCITQCMMNVTEYNWLSDAKYRPMENKNRPWKIEWKKENCGYGSSYFQNLNDALSFKNNAKVSKEFPF